MNLSLLLDMAADGFGDRIVLGFRDGGMTAERLRRRSLAGSRILRDRAADGLIYLGVNSPLFPASLFAAARAGVPLIPLNYRLGDEQLRQLIAHHPNAVAVADDEHCERVAAEGIETFSMTTWGAALDEPAAATDAPEDDRPAVLIYTSGTTSAPEGGRPPARHLLSVRLRHGRIRSRPVPKDATLDQRAAVSHRRRGQPRDQPLRGPPDR